MATPKKKVSSETSVASAAKPKISSVPTKLPAAYELMNLTLTVPYPSGRSSIMLRAGVNNIYGDELREILWKDSTIQLLVNTGAIVPLPFHCNSGSVNSLGIISVDGQLDDQQPLAEILPGADPLNRAKYLTGSEEEVEAARAKNEAAVREGAKFSPVSPDPDENQ